MFSFLACTGSTCTVKHSGLSPQSRQASSGSCPQSGLLLHHQASMMLKIRLGCQKKLFFSHPLWKLIISSQKLQILAAIYRARLPYTIIDIGCWFEVFVPKLPSGRSDHAHWSLIDHRIVDDGNQKFALIDRLDIGKYVAQIISDNRTINQHVFVYTELLSMNEIWDTMATISGEEPFREYVSGLLLQSFQMKLLNWTRSGLWGWA